MNPETKLILDEMSKFSEHDAKWDQRMVDLEKRSDLKICNLERA